VRLFERTARGVVLTESGRVFAGHAKEIQARLKDASTAMRDLRTGRSGLVRIGVGIGIPQALLAEATRPLVRQGMMIEILGGTSGTFARMLLNGEIDIAVSGSGFADTGELVWKPLLRDPLVVAAPAGHPLLRRRAVAWAELSGQTWLVPAGGSEARGWFDHQFRSRGLAMPKAMLALRDHPFPLQLGIELGALALLGRCRLDQAEAGRAYREVAMASEDDVFDRAAGLVWRAKGYLSPTAQRLMRQVEAAACRFAPWGGQGGPLLCGRQRPAPAAPGARAPGGLQRLGALSPT
jgi:DNA-binding transcriptional LysR family regulator